MKGEPTVGWWAEWNDDATATADDDDNSEKSSESESVEEGNSSEPKAKEMEEYNSTTNDIIDFDGGGEECEWAARRVSCWFWYW